jgi:hypothetical protein
MKQHWTKRLPWGPAQFLGPFEGATEREIRRVAALNPRVILYRQFYFAFPIPHRQKLEYVGKGLDSACLRRVTGSDTCHD